MIINMKKRQRRIPELIRMLIDLVKMELDLLELANL